MKIAFLGDVHFGIRNDSEILSEYQKKFFVDVFFPYLKENNIKKVIQVGDFFDRRQYINFKTLHHIKEYFPSLLIDNDVEMYVLLGNHDTALKSSNHINSPSLLLSDIPNIHVIDDLTEVTISQNNENFTCAMIPWINNSNYSASIDFINKTNCDYVAGHFELKGFEMHRGHVCETGMDISIFDRFHKVISGHFHTKCDRGNILYTGTPYELNWNDWNDKKGFWVLDTETHDIYFVPNQNTLFHKIEYWNTMEKEIIRLDPPTDSIKGKYVKLICIKKEDDYAFEQFIKKSLSEMPNDLNVVLSSVEMSDNMDIDTASKTLTQLIIENVNSLDLTEVTLAHDELKKSTIDLLVGIHAEVGYEEL